MDKNRIPNDRMFFNGRRGQNAFRASFAFCLTIFIFILSRFAGAGDDFSPRFKMPKFEDYVRTITKGSVSASSGDMIYTYNCASLPMPGAGTFDLNWIYHSKSGAALFNWQKFLYKETWMENGSWMPNARIYFHDGSGSRSEFIIPDAGALPKGGMGTFASDVVRSDGSEYGLQVFSDNNGNTIYMVIADKHGAKMYFEPAIDYTNTAAGNAAPPANIRVRWEKGYLMLTKVADRNGNEINFSYKPGEITVWTNFGVYKKPFDILESISLPGGRSIRFGYDVKNNVTSISAPEGNNTTFRYDPAMPYISLPIAIIDAMGRAASFRYIYRFANGFGGMMTSVTNPRGKKTSYAYRGFPGDEKTPRCYKITDPAGNHEHYNYDVYNYLTTYTDKAGFETEYTYHMDGLILQERRPDYSVIFSKYDMLKFDRNTNMGGSPVPNYWFPSDIDEAGDAPSRDPQNSNATNVGSPYDRGYGAPYDIPSDITRDHYNSTITIDGNKNMTKYQYDVMDNVLWVKYPEARYAGSQNRTIHHVNYEYDPVFNFETKSAQTVNGAWVEERNIYDSKGNLIEHYDPEITKTSYAYSSSGNMISKTVCAGQAAGNMTRTTFYGYDANGSVTSITDPGGRTTTFTSDSYGRILTKTDPKGYTTTYSYDKAGNLLLAVYPDKTSQKALYDKNDNMIAYKDRNNNWTVYVYDDADTLREIHNPDGGIIYAEYDADGRKKKEVDPNGHVTLYSFTYDGKPLQKIDAINNPLRYGYDYNGNNTCVIDPSGSQTLCFYDGRNNKVKEIDSLGNETVYEYDEAGNIRSRTCSIMVNSERKYLTTRYNYDRNNRLIEEIDPMNHSVKYTYDSAGNKLTKEDPNGKTTRYTYDANNRLISIKDHLGKVTKYSYDENGSLKSIIDANNHITAFTYDSMNRRISETDAMGKTTSFKYDSNDNLIEKKYPSGNKIVYEYDKMNRLVSITYPNKSKVRYAYDKAGNKLSMIDSRGITLYEYDDINRLVKVTYPDSHIIEYAYDKSGLRKSKLEDNIRLTEYEYDPLKCLTKIISPDEGIIEYSYDELGRRVQSVYANDTSTDYAYNDSGWLILQTNRTKDGEFQYGYTYDNAGNRLAMTDNEGLHSYLYDNNYRLTKVTYPDSNWTEYGYDNVGNRLYKKDRSGATNYTYNNANMMLSSGSETFAYDNNGNLVKKVSPQSSATYSYDYDNRLIKVNLSIAGRAPQAYNNTITFAYDGDGKRISKTAGGITARYYWDMDNISTEIIGSLTKSYTHGPKVDEIARRADYAGATRTDYHYHTDGLGSVTQITDDTGANLVHYSYDVFGEIRKQTGAEPGNNYLFAGRLMDKEIELYYNRARYYAPKYGRFITKDTREYDGYDPFSLHKYLYANANPVINIDPDGLLTVFIHGTYSEPGVFTKEYMKKVAETLGETHRTASMKWSGYNTDKARKTAARGLAKMINEYKFLDNEKLNIIGHSHGGNVAFLLSQEKTVHKIDTLVALGTPIREYKPNMENIGEMYNVFSEHDMVQSAGGGGMKIFDQELGKAGKTLPGIQNIGVPEDKGVIKTHGYLYAESVWDKYIRKAIEKHKINR